jgi:hypothetical protein
VTGGAEGVGQRQMEIYWSTGLMPEFCGFASAGVAWPAEGDLSIEISDIICWPRTGTPLLRLRIDPCPGSGMSFLIRRVVLSAD